MSLLAGFRDPVILSEHYYCASRIRLSSPPRRVIDAAAGPLSDETDLFRLFCSCLLCTLRPPPRLVATGIDHSLRSSALQSLQERSLRERTAEATTPRGSGM